MIPEQLEPRLEMLRQEYVLVQAWKKTAHYIRRHNWFSDTLALDCVAINLPTFIAQLRERLQCCEKWTNDHLRIVPAPKSQAWKVEDTKWGPDKEITWSRLRPLAHVALEDQVVATTLMLCLANRVETQQGDPRKSVKDLEERKQVISYGNRLFCDVKDSQLRHRWGSVKLYRAYFQDYRTFVSRPETAAGKNKDRLHIVHTDLKQFYDRVRPEVLSAATNRLREDGDDPGFFSFVASVFDWGWHPRDQSEIQSYEKQSEFEGFTRVALPQGLVASGFFSNVVLLSFDTALRTAIGTEITSNIRLVDSCRYVDDLRILVEPDKKEDEIKADIFTWLHRVLNNNAPGLQLSDEKTRVKRLAGDGRPTVRQNAKMNRIQSAVSGGFDALGGLEILDAIQGLMRVQESRLVNSKLLLSPIAEVRDATVARFGAGRYRTTFRSIRPLLEDNDAPKGRGNSSGKRLRMDYTRNMLDEDMRVFALGLIQRWIDNPSNIRLLRIGLDLWPDVELLRKIFSLLRPFTEQADSQEAQVRVAWYCLAEILRAGATETGFVVNEEAFPSTIDLKAYHKTLHEEAVRLLTPPISRGIPWYLRQQALLFLAAYDPTKEAITCTEEEHETRQYWNLIRFLCNEGEHFRDSEFTTFAVLVRRAFLNRKKAITLISPNLNRLRSLGLAQRDPSFFLELIDAGTDDRVMDSLPEHIRRDLCLQVQNPDTLAKKVLDTHPIHSLRNELSLLHFAKAFLTHWEKQESTPDIITPEQVVLTLTFNGDMVSNKVVVERFLRSEDASSDSLYQVPVWCKVDQKWRFQLGFLLRFILSGQPDFTRSVRRASWKENRPMYRPPESHWYQRLYGFYNGQQGFGDDWLPISDWMERFLLALLRWPGCRAPKGFDWIGYSIEKVISQIDRKIEDLESLYGKATDTLILKMRAKPPTATNTTRQMGICVVQTAFPTDEDFTRGVDITLNQPDRRRKHRNYLSTTLAAVERMLVLHKMHKVREWKLDWLILPELAVHPEDVRTHLIPFARAHKTLILSGLTYQEIQAGHLLINSALWVIPEWSDAYGLQIKIRRQGKKHLAPKERDFMQHNIHLQSFRPCQWLISYPWSEQNKERPVWLTAAICHDATDPVLGKDLRDKSDVLVVPALNKDVETFDQSALALHNDMCQMVIVANNGQYGGSNAYWPHQDAHARRVFHIHGQSQASITFLEIDKIGEFLKRRIARISRQGCSTTDDAVFS